MVSKNNSKEGDYTVKDFLSDIQAVGFIETFTRNEVDYLANPLMNKYEKIGVFINTARKALLGATIPYFLNKISTEELKELFSEYVKVGKEKYSIDVSEEFNNYFENLRLLRENKEISKLAESGKLEKILKKEDASKITAEQDKDVT